MKQFLCKIFLAVALLGAIFGYRATRLLTGACSGDLATVLDPDYLIFFTHKPDFPERPVTTTDYRQDAAGALDSAVLVLGDSFTQLGSRSFPTYLQHFLPERRVLQINTQNEAATSQWKYVHASLMGSDELLVFDEAADFVTYLLEQADSVPGTIILESGERFAPIRLSMARYGLTDADFHRYDDVRNTMAVANSQQDIIGGRNIDITSSDPIRRVSGVVQFLQADVKHLFGVRRIYQRIEGDRPLFTARGDERSIFQLKHPCLHSSDEVYAKAQENLHRLFALAESRGVTLIYFVCPDKYTIYQPYMLGDHPQSEQREKLKAMEADPHYECDYDLLDSAVRAGVKDVYISTDTHWSYKAAELTARSLADRIRRLSSH